MLSSALCLFVICLFVCPFFFSLHSFFKPRHGSRCTGTMRFAHGWPIERVSPLLSSSSLSRASSEAPRDTDTADDDDGVRARGVAPSSSSSRVVAATLDATSRTLAIVTSSGIELWDSGRNRVVLCEKRKPKTASEYIHAEWKPNYHVRGEDGTRDEDDDENASASHKERTLLVMTKSGNLLVFIVSVGKVDEFSGGSGRSTNEKSTTRNASAGSEQQCGTMRSASCVLKKAIKIRVIPPNVKDNGETEEENLLERIIDGILVIHDNDFCVRERWSRRFLRDE